MLYFQDYKSFIEGAINGVILFSLGFTGFDSKDIPTAVVTAFLSAFSQLQQRVIMRFDPKYLPYKPNNVMAEEWIPQQEILGKYGYYIDKYWNFYNSNCYGTNF